jgi:hypothetical protein
VTSSHPDIPDVPRRAQTARRSATRGLRVAELDRHRVTLLRADPGASR